MHIALDGRAVIILVERYVVKHQKELNLVKKEAREHSGKVISSPADGARLVERRNSRNPFLTK